MSLANKAAVTGSQIQHEFFHGGVDIPPKLGMKILFWDRNKISRFFLYIGKPKLT